MKLISPPLLLLALFAASCQSEGLRNEAEADLKGRHSFSAGTGFATGEIDSKVGIVTWNREGEPACFQTKNSALTKGTPVRIVTGLFSPPQKVFEAAVALKFEKSCAPPGSSAAVEEYPETNHFYGLRLKGSGIDLTEYSFGIGLTGSLGETRVEEESVSIDLDGDGEREYFRHCTSFEGMHLTIWNGKPLTGKRIWHNYYYLGYDTVPDCAEKDYIGT